MLQHLTTQPHPAFATSTKALDCDSARIPEPLPIHLHIHVNMQVFARLAALADKVCDSHALEAVYKKNLFRPTTIKPQQASHFMSLPTEIRLIIYSFVFTPPYDKTRNVLSLLATCRKVHGEAIVMALNTTQFHLDGNKGLSFQSKLWGLGELQQHLRRIDIRMPMQRLNGNSSNNPFVLTGLPLSSLEIDFEMIEDIEKWAKENRIYHRFVSALLHQTTAATLGSQTVPLHKSMVEKNKRRARSALLKTWATKKQLYHMIAGMNTKTLVVKCTDNGKDILWSAFTHFELVEDTLTVMRVGGISGPKHHIMFYDTEGQNVLEIGH